MYQNHCSKYRAIIRILTLMYQNNLRYKIERYFGENYGGEGVCLSPPGKMI